MVSPPPKRWFFFILAMAFLFSAHPAQTAEKVPPLRGRINDYAGILSVKTVQELEVALQTLEQTDSTQIVVLTMPSLEGEAIEDFSMRVADAWKIGQKGLDNGAILIVSKNDRKLRIEVGYGLEGRMTDLIAGRIVRNIIVPEFKRGDFDQGIVNGVQAMIATVHGEFETVDGKRSSSGDSSNGPFFSLFIFIFFISQLGRIRRSVGTVAGGILLPILGAVFFPAGLLLLLALVPVGLLAGFVLSVIGAATGGSASRYRSGGGGGFSSGGFGGFSGGGGSFGGGGASGGW